MSVSTRKPERRKPIKPVMIESVQQLEEFCRRHRDGEGECHFELRKGKNAWDVTVTRRNGIFTDQILPFISSVGVCFHTIGEMFSELDVSGSTIRLVA